MCGIAGLFAKTAELEEQLGAQLARMLVILGERGPDSTGFALYGHEAPAGSAKLSLRARSGAPDWDAIGRRLAERFGDVRVRESGRGYAVLVVSGGADEIADHVRTTCLDVQVLSTGSSIELFKEVGRPADVAALFSLATRTASHALGHTRMATESRVTTEGSHPFSTGPDLCLVHNGSLSNHNRLRRELRRHGIDFQTENDSEVAAGYLTWRMREGASLEQALNGCLDDLDGFYTFAVGTADGFAVLRDPIACKPAVMAETDEWVAVATEYRAIAGLPGAAHAEVWEPAPGQIYVWERERVA
jgi:glutamate synthase domain-containing protein 1